jgi:hypothetical protein
MLLKKVLVVDKDGPASSEQWSNGKGNSKETITRYNGHLVVNRAVAPILKNLRKGSGLKKCPGWEAFHQAKYEVCHYGHVCYGVF